MAIAVRRNLSLLLVGLMAAFVAAAIIQGCGSGGGTTADKHTLACQQYCRCQVTSLDLSSCTNLCLSNAGGSFNFTTTTCYDCIIASSCAELNNGACFGSTATQCQ